MARLTLTLATTPPGGTPKGAAQALETGRLTIGRGPDNDWILLDPERHLSKQHCEIANTGDAFVVTDTSTNGVFVNGAPAPLGRGQSHALAAGDYLRLGEYEMVARIEDDVSRVDLDDYAQPRSQWPAFEDHTYYGAGSAPPHDEAAGAGDDGWIGGRREEREADAAVSPFAERAASWDEDPIRPAPPPRPPATPSDHLAAEHDVMPTPRMRHERAPDGLGEDWDEELEKLLGDDPLAPPEPAAKAPPPSAATARQKTPYDDAPVASAPLDDLESLDDVLGGDPLEPSAPGPDVASSGAAAGPGPAQAPAPSGGANPFAADRESRPEPPAAESGPASESAAPPAATPARRHDPAGAGAEALVAAFLRGAGLPEVPRGTAPEALMETAGALLAAMTTGLRDLLAARTALKNEIRVEQTMIQASANNALKFSASSHEALERLLARPDPAFEDGRASVDKAFRDLKSHEMATMAASSAAIKAVLATFDPARLEDTLSGRGGMGGLLSGGKRARLWELYEAHYRTLADEATEDFDSRFQREFRKVYEQLVRDL